MTDPNEVDRVLEAAAMGFRTRYGLDTERRVEIVVPTWWVQRHGEERIAECAARLDVKVTAVDADEDLDRNSVHTLVFEEGTWHKEQAPPLDLGESSG